MDHPGPANGSSKTPKRYYLRLARRGDWHRFHNAERWNRGVFVPTSAPPEIGSRLTVQVIFQPGQRFLLRGVVVWRRLQKHSRARAGVGIHVDDVDLDTLSFIEAWVRGGLLNRRAAPRLPVSLRVTYTVPAGKRMSLTGDLSESGIYIRATELLEPRAPIRMQLLPPGDSRPHPLSGHVARRVDREQERGMGIALEFRDEDARARYLALLERLEHDVMSGRVPLAVS